MELLNQLIEETGSNYNINNINILRIESSLGYNIIDNNDNILNSYNIIIFGNQKLYLDITDVSIIINNEVEIIPKNEILYYSLIDDILTFLEKLENIEIQKYSNYEEIVNDTNNFINSILNIKNNQ